MTGSRIAGFYRLDVETRRRRLAAAVGLPADEVAALAHSLPIAVADVLVENAVGTFALPFGVALNFRVNGRDRVVPMVVEEPSVIAAASNAALLARAAGGFVAEADRGAMIGQIQLVGVPRPALAAERLRAARTRLLAAAAGLAPGLCRRGAGPRGLEVRIVQATSGDAMVVVHVLVDTGDAMGANLVNSLVEGLAPLIATIAGGTPCLRIVSNLADHRRARARVRIPLASLTTDDVPGVEVAERVRWAQELAANDPYRAATHNKGIMNGVDAVALATGNDWRAIEAGAHAYAARDGRYRPLSTWTVDDGHLVGTIEMPMATSIVGRLVQSHPQVALALRILNVQSARELAMVMVAVGLASNLGALRALVTSGIQRGHMALHARAAGMR
jgi:hydroxymethylglutaryl-CoA reductase